MWHRADKGTASVGYVAPEFSPYVPTIENDRGTPIRGDIETYWIPCDYPNMKYGRRSRIGNL